VGHGGSTLVLTSIILKKELKDIKNIKKLENTAIAKFEINNKVKTICLNCTKHL